MKLTNFLGLASFFCLLISASTYDFEQESMALRKDTSLLLQNVKSHGKHARNILKSNLSKNEMLLGQWNVETLNKSDLKKYWNIKARYLRLKERLNEVKPGNMNYYKAQLESTSTDLRAISGFIYTQQRMAQELLAKCQSVYGKL